jgi:hypothetical protein
MNKRLYSLAKQACALLVSTSIAVAPTPVSAGVEGSAAPQAPQTSAVLLPIPKVAPKAFSGSHSPSNTKQKPLVASRSDKPGPLQAMSPAAVRGANELTFVENKGQFDEQVKFQVSSGGRTLWLTGNGIVLDCLRRKPAQVDGASPLSDVLAGNVVLDRPGTAGNPHVQTSAVRDMERHVIYEDFVRADNEITIETKGVRTGMRNYLSGNDPSKWQTQVRGFSEVVYHDVWKGVNLRLHGNGPDLEQEFIVNPGADVGQVQIAYKGIDRLELAKDGSLVIRTAAGQMRESAPRIYQEIAGRRVFVKGKFKLLSATSYTFEVVGHNAKQALIIDPTLLYSTFLGGSVGNNIFTIGTHETATGIAVDQAGNAYVTGFTGSGDFPTTPGAFQTTNLGGQQTFVTKLNPAGGALIYSTYLSASFPSGIAVDPLGNAYVAGSNTHDGFATTPNAYSQSCSAPGGLPFLSVLNASGSGLLYSTCFGSFIPNAGGVATVTSMAADANGHAYLGGLTGFNLPTTPNGYQTAPPGSLSSGFVMEFDTNLSGSASLVYSTYLGAPRAAIVNGVAVDSFGKIYVTGATDAGFPVTAGAFQTIFPGQTCSGGVCSPSTAAFIAKLDPAASGTQSLIYSTYLAGIGSSVGTAIAVDGSGNAYVGGTTSSSNFPVTPGAFQTASTSCGAPLFVTKLNAVGSNLSYSTYLCGNIFANDNSIGGIAIDSLGDAYVAGGFRAQAPSTFPVTPDAFQNSFTKLGGDFHEAFLTKLNQTGSALIYSTYFGGAGDDVATGVAIDQIGDAYIAGHTASANLPTRNPFQLTMNGTGDAFIAKFGTGAGGSLSVLSFYPAQGGNSGSITPTITGSGFHYGATASLSCSSNANIPGANLSVSPDGRLISARFSLIGQSPGPCSVTVTNLDGSTASLSTAVTVVQGGSQDIQVDLFGPNGARGGLPTTYLAGYTNRGANDSKPFRLWISFPNFFSWTPPPGTTPASAGQQNGVIYVGFDIPSVPAGTSGWIPIQLTAPTTLPFHQPFQVQAWEEVQ